MRKLHFLPAIFLPLILSGCFDGYMDCDDSDNIESFEEILIKAVKSKAMYSLDFFSDLRYLPKIELTSFEQISSSDTVNQCKYEFTGLINDVEIPIQASSRIIKIEKGDRDHKVVDIDYSSYSIARIARIAKNLTQTDIYEEESIKYRFKNVEEYKNFLALKEEKVEVKNKLNQLEKMASKRESEIAKSTSDLNNKLEILQKYKKQLAEKIRNSEKPKFHNGSITFTIDRLDIKNREFEVSFTNPEKYQVESASFRLYIFEQGKYDKPIFKTVTGETFGSQKTTHLHASFNRWGTYDDKGKVTAQFSRHLNRELDRIKSKISDPTEIETLIIPNYFDTRDDISRYNLKWHEITKVENTLSDITKLERSIKYLKNKFEALQVAKKGFVDNIKVIEDRAKILNPKGILEI